MSGSASLRLDPRLARLRDVLDPLGDVENREVSAPGRIHAAVSLVLRIRDSLEVLLIRRAEADGDPWSGHMALPGGRRDPGDGSLLETALRETREETDLSLDRVGCALGRLEPLRPGNERLPPIAIFPFVFGMPGESEARAASREVDEIHWVPLAALLDPAAVATEPITHDGATRDFPCFRVEGRAVWGLTYRILTDFLGRLKGTGLLSEGLPPARPGPGRGGEGPGEPIP